MIAWDFALTFEKLDFLSGVFWRLLLESFGIWIASRALTSPKLDHYWLIIRIFYNLLQIICIGLLNKGISFSFSWLVQQGSLMPFRNLTYFLDWVVNLWGSWEPWIALANLCILIGKHVSTMLIFVWPLRHDLGWGNLFLYAAKTDFHVRCTSHDRFEIRI